MRHKNQNITTVLLGQNRACGSALCVAAWRRLLGGREALPVRGSSKFTVSAISSSQLTPQPHRDAFTHLRRCLAISWTRTGTRSWRFLLPDLELHLPRPYICRSGNSGYGKKPYGKTIGKLVTDSFLVAKKQRSISAMGSVHNKISPDVSAVVSRTLSSYRLPYKKGKDTLSTN